MTAPFLAGQRVTAGQLNDAVQKTLQSIEVGIAGGIATTAGATELDIPELAVGPVDLVGGALYAWEIRLATTRTSATDLFNVIIRRDTPLTGTVISDWIIPAAPATTSYVFTAWDDMISAIDDPGVQFYTSIQRLSGGGTITVAGQLSGSNRSGIKLVRTGYSSAFQVVT